MDSTQLERGTLESKDRDELTTIANALGGKPGSRARKAEIVRSEEHTSELQSQ